MVEARGCQENGGNAKSGGGGGGELRAEYIFPHLSFVQRAGDALMR
jgi:hypothetical protein